MEILVCIKQVPDDSVEIHLDPGTGLPSLASVTPVVNAFDTYALEMAARLAEQDGGEITVFTYGPAKAKDALKSCLSVGAGNAFIYLDENWERMDFPAMAHLLEKAVRQMEEVRRKPFDLIFCGTESTDRATGQTGPQLAGEMHIGCITDIVDLEINEKGICGKQETEEGYRLIQSHLPCLVTVTKPEYDPRYPTIKSKIAARKIPITELQLEESPEASSLAYGSETSAFSIVRIYEPEKKQGGIRIKEETFTESAIKAVHMMAEAKLL